MGQEGEITKMKQKVFIKWQKTATKGDRQVSVRNEFQRFFDAMTTKTLSLVATCPVPGHTR